MLIGKIIHIGKAFKSYNGVDLNNRFMCIIEIKDGFIKMLPMSTFHDEQQKNKKLAMKFNFEYSISQGNNRNGYIKCDQIYSLSIDDFNKFPAEIKVKHRMEPEQFQKLLEYIKELSKSNEKAFVYKDVVFQEIENER